jgi:tetratricopeptide (TPR) repeat protein
MKGLSERGAKQLSAALASLRKAVELDGSQVSYKIALGQTLLQAKQYGDAYSVLKPLNPSSMDAQYRSSYALLFAQAATKTNRPEEAVPVLRSQISADARNANLQQALGVAYEALGDDAKTYEAFKKAYDLDPKDQASGRNAIKAAINAGRRANASSKTRYYNNAASLADKLAAASPTFDHYLLAGEAWLGAKQYSKAMAQFDKAQQKQPQNALLHFYRGQCYSSLNQFDNALDELQKALNIGVSGKLRTNLYNQLGFVYDKKKDYTNAKQAYSEAGNSRKAAEMTTKQEQADLNAAADAEMAEFRRTLQALELQIEELDKLGEVEEANQLREQLAELKKALK